MLTMLAYVYYSKQPVLYRYLLMFFVFALGLLAKPMLVTLPCVLLLLDYWPLRRFSYGPPGGIRTGKPKKVIMSGPQGFSPFRLVLEKIPLLVLSVLSICLSFLSAGKVSVLLAPMKLRIANALVSYVKYIGKLIWPQDLAILYPYPSIVPMWQTIGALLLLVCVSVLLIRTIRGAPYFAIGWLWYLGTLVPVIGLVQKVALPAMADRFAYVPFIGIFIIIAWGIPELVAKWRYRKIWLATSATVVLTILMAMTWKQVGYWKNSITLFEHNLKITSNNYVAHNNLGTAISKQGRTAEAIDHYLKALRIKPDYAEGHNNLGAALSKQGRTAEAIDHYLKALRIKPDEAKTHYNLGTALSKQGRTAEAIDHYLKALRIKPDYAKAHYNLGNALSKQGRTAEAIDHYLKALRIKPDYAKAHHNLGNALLRKGNVERAIAHFRKALRINPDYVHVKNNLKKVLMVQQQNK
jgi:Flp pilus assembly protein TadD